MSVVVNGFLTKQSINLINPNLGYKNKILVGIKEYIENGKDCKNIVTKKITMSYLESIYSKNIIKNIQKFLMPINKEESRDKLTELGLVK